MKTKFRFTLNQHNPLSRTIRANPAGLLEQWIETTLQVVAILIG